MPRSKPAAALTARLRGGALAAGAVLALALAACGSDDDASSGSSATASGGDLSELRAEVKRLSDPDAIEFPMPDEPVTPGERRVAVITAGLAGQGASAVAPYVEEAIQAIGWQTPSPFDGKFDPSTQSGLIQRAVREGYDGIILIAITPSSVSTAVAAANDADVPIVCVNCGPDPNKSAAPGVIHADPSAKLVGRAQALYAISETDGKGKIFVFRDEAFGQTIVQTAASERTLRERCSGCTVESEEMTVKDAVTPGVPFFTGFMSAHPQGAVDIVLSPYDTASAPFVEAAQEAGRTDIGMVGFGSLNPFFEMVAAGDPPGAMATVSVPIPFESWAGVDQLARALAGDEPWDSSALPVALVTKQNASKFDPEAPYLKPNFDFQAQFQRLWGGA